MNINTITTSGGAEYLQKVRLSDLVIELAKLQRMGLNLEKVKRTKRNETDILVEQERTLKASALITNEIKNRGEDRGSQADIIEMLIGVIKIATEGDMMIRETPGVMIELLGDIAKTLRLTINDEPTS